MRSELVICFILLGMLAIGLLGLLSVIVPDGPPCAEPRTGWQPPNLSLCPKGMTRWDCLRDAAYRSDI